MLSPVKSIRLKCFECSGRQRKEVRECLIPECPLYPFRIGKNPNRKGIGGIRLGLAEETELS